MINTQVQLSGGSHSSRMAPLMPDRPVNKLDNETLLALMDRLGRVDESGRDSAHQQMHRTWFVNLVAYAGVQNLDVTSLMRDRDLNFDVPEEELAYTANHILRAVRGNVARKAAAKPSWDVTPMTPDERDQVAAKVAQMLLEHAYEALEAKKIRRNMSYWLENCGNAFLYVGWDEKGGRRYKVYRNPLDGSIVTGDKVSPEDEQFLEDVGSSEEIYEGEWEFEVVSPFDVKVPHRYLEMEKMPWCIMERRVSMDWIWDNYPKHAKDVRPDEMVSNTDTDYMRRLASLTNGHGRFLSTSSNDEDEIVRLQYLWVPPSRRFKRGIYAVRTRTKILENEPHPSITEKVDIRFPLIHCRNIYMPGRFWGMSTTEHLLEAQRDYNRARTQMIEVRDRIAHPITLVPKQAEITSSRNDIGLWVEYDRMGGKPEIVPPPPLSGWHEATKEQALTDMQQIAAMSEASQGNVPDGVRSGVAITALQEQDEEITANSVEEIEDAFTKAGRMLLQWFKAKATMERAVRVYGKSQASDVQFFKGSDIDGQYAVRITPGSMKPRSKQQTVAYMDALMQRGILNPMIPAHRRLVLDAYELGGTDALHRHEDADRRRALIENELFARPGAEADFTFPDVDQYDDHQVHLDEHLAFYKSDEYERWPVMRKVAFQAHMAKHMEAISMMAQAQQMWQSMSSGGGGSPPAEKGEPSPPSEKQPTPGTQGKEPSQ